MASIRIKKGFDIKLVGAPTAEIVDATATDSVTIYPQEFTGFKPRLDVKEGDAVKRGSILFHNKQNERQKLRSPAGGIVKSILLGARRSLQAIVIDVARSEDVEALPSYAADRIRGLSREEVLNHLLDTGLIALIQQRPFSGMADADANPKSIFVNGMSTAPFQSDFNVLLQGEETAFQAGLDVMTRLTRGKVHLCLGKNASASARNAANNVDVHTFSGPHPAGNTSVHIHYLDPIRPGDTVWAARAAGVIQIGKLFLDGKIPASKVISVGGPGVKAAARKHYRVRIGGELSSVLEGNLEEGEQRVISGDVLSGREIGRDGGVRFFDTAITVIPENRERHFLGWLAPGLNRFSSSRLYLSRWLKAGAEWSLSTNANGSPRAMVLTGLYDKYMPMRIKVDFLVRAVLAHDAEEAVQLGLLETDPEDFALCAFACPSKMDLVGIIRQGLREVKAEGI